MMMQEHKMVFLFCFCCDLFYHHVVVVLWHSNYVRILCATNFLYFMFVLMVSEFYASCAYVFSMFRMFLYAKWFEILLLDISYSYSPVIHFMLYRAWLDLFSVVWNGLQPPHDNNRPGALSK